jgi:hypothetical protein
MPATSINRRELVSKHNPVLNNLDFTSPLSVGNGDFVFTADITGLQTLHGQYGVFMPLCTMAQWGWHSKPNAKGGFYSIDDVVMEEYDFLDRKVRFALTMQEGNEEPYVWNRKNPHRANLARIAFKWDGKPMEREKVMAMGGFFGRAQSQCLHLYEGYLESNFVISDSEEHFPCKVLSACDPERDLLAFQIECDAIKSGRLTVEITFPYGDHHVAGGLCDCPEKHSTAVLMSDGKSLRLRRQQDRDCYFVSVFAETDGARLDADEKRHSVVLSAKGFERLCFGAEFSQRSPAAGNGAFAGTCAVFANAAAWWGNFWETGAAVRLSKSSHPKAEELERRIVLSQYLLAIQSAGSMPPAETGLTCNSWYGKFHLEMHLWHAAYLPLWGHVELLERSIEWYHEILPKAKWNAERNGYIGARWPKMTGPEGIDSPSFIATLLIWQQPHILYMLELAYHAKKQDRAFADKHWELISETADFMADLVVFNEARGVYELLPPLVPAEENSKPRDTKNLAFELAYWKFGIKTAIGFAERLGKPIPAKWKDVYDKISPPPMRSGRYVQQELDSHSDKFPGYKPVIVGLIGLLPGEGIDQRSMRESMAEFMESKTKFMIGWSFPYFAMCAARLGMAREAVELLLMDNASNIYLKNGHNPQGAPESLPGLPIYLPGNGALLLGVALMAQGYAGSGFAPAFREEDGWVVETDGLMPIPF